MPAGRVPQRAQQIPVSARKVPSSSLLSVPVILLLVLGYRYWGFVQDDAFISFRYARNLIEGHGLVFNPGERVEGYSNFLWTVLMAVPIGLDVDPPLVSAAASLVCAAGALIIFHALCRLLLSPAGATVAALPVVLLSTSTSFSLWAVSGMETSLFVLLALTGAYLLVLDGTAPTRSPRRLVGAALAFALASLTRPEGPLFIVLAGCFTLFVDRERRERPPRTVVFAGVVLGVLAPYYAWKIAYYGSVLPNTYYVKAAGGGWALKHGAEYVAALLLFNYNWLLIVFALVSLARRERSIPKIFCAAVVVLLTLYMVKIGGDILPMYRLYIPALPFLYVLAAEGMVTVVHLVDRYGTRLVGRRTLKDSVRYQIRGGAIAILALVAVAIAASNFRTSFGHPEYAGVLEALKNCHVAIARFLNENHRAGDVVLAQDMGAMPYYARRLHFVDVIGLTDARVAREMYDANYTPYLRYLMWGDPVQRARIEAMDDRLKEYLLSYDGRYMIYNVFIPQSRRPEVLAAIERRDEAFFLPFVRENTFYHNIGGDPRFVRNYRLRTGWTFSFEYYLLLYERVTAPGG